MRVLLAGLLLAAPLSAARAEDKIDPKLLLGKWELAPGTGKAAEAGLALEFLPGGKAKAEFRLAGMTDKVDGTYTIDGNKVRLTTKDPGGRENVSVITVLALSEAELVASEDGQPKQTYRRAKAKK